MALAELGVPAPETARADALLADHDQRALEEGQAFYDDERRLIQGAKQEGELAGLFENDRPEGPRDPAGGRARKRGRETATPSASLPL